VWAKSQSGKTKKYNPNGLIKYNSHELINIICVVEIKPYGLKLKEIT